MKTPPEVVSQPPPPLPDPNNRPQSNETLITTTKQRSQPHVVSREKYRAMSGTWERGLDPETADLESAKNETDNSANQHPAGRGAISSESHGTRGKERRVPDDRERFPTRGGGVPSENEGFSRRGGGGGGARGNVDGDRNGLLKKEAWSGPSGRNSSGGIGVRGERESGRRGAGGEEKQGYDSRVPGVADAEPQAKRPRVTSTIVIAGDINGGGDDSLNSNKNDNGVMDRWDAGAATDPTAAVAATEGGGRTPPKDAAANVDDSGADGESAVVDAAENDGQPRFTSTIIVVPGSRTEARHPRLRRGGSNRVSNIVEPREERVIGVRGSLASRLGPVVGRPVIVKYVGGTGGDGANGNEDGEIDAPPLRPMPEPSKPELQAAYKDGATKIRNRR